MMKKGQVSLEAVLLITLFVIAFLCVQHYLKRAIAANWRSNADSFSDEQFDDSSHEMVSALEFVDSRFNVSLPQGKQTIYVSVAGSQPVIHIHGWGIYGEGSGLPE